MVNTKRDSCEKIVASLNGNQESSKKELKKENSLAIKMISGKKFDEYKDMTCLTRRFQKWERKDRGLRKVENSNRAANANQQCHKCKDLGHFTRDFPMHKVEVKNYQRPGVEKGRKRDPVFDKKSKKSCSWLHYEESF